MGLPRWWLGRRRKGWVGQPPHRHRELQRVNHAGNRGLRRFADQKMNVLRHDDITGHNKAVAGPHALQRFLEEITSSRRAQMLEPVITTESKKMKIPCMFVTDESSRHRRKAYNRSESMSRKNRKRATKVHALPGAQKRGTWGTPRWWGNSLCPPAPGPRIMKGRPFPVSCGCCAEADNPSQQGGTPR